MSGSLYEAYQTDEQAEEQGAWVEVRAGVRLRIRSDNSLKARDWAMRRAKGQRQLLLANGHVLPPKLQDKNEIDMCTEVLITAWDGVTDRDGNLLAFSRDAAKQLMTDLPALRREILYASRTEETFRKEEVEQLGKISAPPSAPNSGSEAAPSA